MGMEQMGSGYQMLPTGRHLLRLLTLEVSRLSGGSREGRLDWNVMQQR